MSTMLLPTSMSPPDPESFSDASASTNSDTTTAFTNFLDIISPLELFRILRARVNSLLLTWPSRSASTIDAPSSSSRTPSNTSSHSRETVAAFTSFLRTQDSPEPSPIDLSATTSLRALHEQLIGVKGLLTYTSSRELKSIIRSRVSENGNDEVAMQGFMEVMRNPEGEDHMSEQLVYGADGYHIVEDRSLNAGGGELEKIDRPVSIEKTNSGSSQSEGRSPPGVEMINPPTSSAHATSEPQNNCDPNPAESVLENLAEVDVHAPDRKSRTSSNTFPNSDEEEGGPLVTSIEEDMTQHGLHVASSLPGSSLPTGRMEPASSDITSSPFVAPTVSTSNSTSGEEHSSPAVGPCIGASHGRWDRKRFRAALGLRSKQLQNDGDADTTSVRQENTQPDVDNGSPSPILKLSETSRVDSDPPRHRFPASRSSSPFLPDPIYEPGSPPGPVLRAVDWDTRAVPASLASVMDVDELDDDQDGSEETLALDGAPYSFSMTTDAEGTAKPTPTFSKTFSYQHTPLLRWEDSNVVRRSVWDDDDERTFGMGMEVDQDNGLTQSAAASSAGPRERLFIRLPARRSKALGTGTVSSGTDVSTSSSVSASSSPRSSYGMTRSSEKCRADYDRGMETGKDDGQSLHIRRPKMLSSLSSRPSSSTPIITPSSATDASSRPSHVSSTSHTPNPMLGVVAHGHNPPHTPHSQPYPPPYHHAHPAHAYPPQWFGAMVYVPFGGAPPVRTHPRGHPQPHPSAHHPVHHHHMLSPGMPSQSSSTPGSSKQSPEISRSPHATASESAPLLAPSPDQPSAIFVSAPSSAMASGSRASSPPVAPPEGPKRHFKRKAPGDDNDTSECEDFGINYTEDVGVKESAVLRRRCYNCHAVQAPSWRKSKLNAGKILCNKCGIYESTHMSPRPLKTRPRRSDGGPAKKRKTKKSAEELDP